MSASESSVGTYSKQQPDIFLVNSPTEADSKAVAPALTGASQIGDLLWPSQQITAGSTDAGCSTERLLEYSKLLHALCNSDAAIALQMGDDDEFQQLSHNVRSEIKRVEDTIRKRTDPFGNDNFLVDDTGTSDATTNFEFDGTALAMLRASNSLPAAAAAVGEEDTSSAMKDQTVEL